MSSSPAPNADPLSALVDIAKRLGDAGDVEAACGAWRRVLQSDPGHLVAHNHLAAFAYHSALPPTALPHLSAVLAARPDDRTAWSRYARLLESVGDFRSATRAYDQVLRLAPSDAAATEGRTRCAVAAERDRAERPGQAPSIRVVAGTGAKHLFRTLQDPRFGVYPAFEDGASEADILVLPCGTSQVLHQSRLFASALPAALRQRIAEGRVLTLLDASTEGELHRPDRTEELHALIGLAGVAPERAVYVTQDRSYEADYAAYRPEGRMAVLHYDTWIWRFFEQFQSKGEAVFEERLALFEARAARRPRRFVSLNFTPRPLKVAFLLSLLRDGLWDKGFISFGGFGHRKVGDARADDYPGVIAEEPGFADMAAALAPLLPDLTAMGETILDPGRTTLKSIVDDRRALPAYADSWFSVVTETEMFERSSRITEKPFKALVNFHPILTFGSLGALAMTRDWGFETFPELFDEGYDEEADVRRRFDHVYGQFTRFCGLEEAALARLTDSVRDKLVHNTRWGLTRLPGEIKARHDAQWIDRLETLLRQVSGRRA